MAPVSSLSPKTSVPSLVTLPLTVVPLLPPKVAPEATFTACWLPISPIEPSPDSHSVPSCTLVSPL
ncbi:Uncharacterised protein [Salmonella enterica subsp. enterica serovar Bovismorbificans]|nr:Uncharacterised protein [Salmonella enterica subsp. enterica serovar Bovismorbificans]CPR81597.1 Uncharacterised protein [Salmonella enterica subsp. enterica serovar Bovismorbificans]CQB66129.1 Uncharacterised protein [Salmonella enterica subsp. enterica serovar Bovismorbificans]